MTRLSAVAAAGVLVLSASGSAQQQAASVPATQQPAKLCKFVTSPGVKPYQMCLSKAEWDAKTLADQKDANRIICHYEEEIGSRLSSKKICMPAGQWADRQRQEREQVERIQREVCVPGAGC